MDKVYFCEVERFGSYFRCAGRTEDEVKKAMIKEYVRVYKQRNGVDPRRGDEVDKEYFNTFLEELYIEELIFGKVEWN